MHVVRALAKVAHERRIRELLLPRNGIRKCVSCRERTAHRYDHLLGLRVDEDRKGRDLHGIRLREEDQPASFMAGPFPQAGHCCPPVPLCFAAFAQARLVAVRGAARGAPRPALRFLERAHRPSVDRCGEAQAPPQLLQNGPVADRLRVRHDASTASQQKPLVLRAPGVVLQVQLGEGWGLEAPACSLLTPVIEYLRCHHVAGCGLQTLDETGEGHGHARHAIVVMAHPHETSQTSGESLKPAEEHLTGSSDVQAEDKTSEMEALQEPMQYGIGLDARMHPQAVKPGPRKNCRCHEGEHKYFKHFKHQPNPNQRRHSGSRGHMQN
mmetsp:Transcript_65627/g.192045  ORF Transcript_65627/g.192045 Transcript_65627/m.192045 type:complete len:325 (+) Transcript_65627:99-1073(+)